MTEQKRALCWTGECDPGDRGWVGDRDKLAEFFRSLGAAVDVLDHPSKQDILNAHRNVDYDYVAYTGHGTGSSVIVRFTHFYSETRLWQKYESLKPWEVGQILRKPVTFSILDMCNSMTPPTSWAAQLLCSRLYPADWRSKGVVLGYMRLAGDREAWNNIDEFNAGLFDLLNDPGTTFESAVTTQLTIRPFMSDNVEWEGNGSLVLMPEEGPTMYRLDVTFLGRGSITKVPDLEKYPPETTVLVTATPGAGYEFSHWTGDVYDVIAGSNPLTVLMNTNKTLVAHFVAVEPEPAAEITDMNGTDRVVSQGETVGVGFSFENTGTIAWIFGAHVALRRPDGTTLAPGVKPVSLVPGGSGSAIWTYTADQVGKWDIACSVWKETAAPYETKLASNEWVEDYITVLATEPEPVKITLPTKAQCEEFGKTTLGPIVHEWLESLK